MEVGMRKVEWEILTDKSLTSSERLVALYIAGIIKDKDSIFCDIEFMSENLGFSYAHVLRLLKSLVKKGVLKVDLKRKGKVRAIKLLKEVSDETYQGNT